MEWFSNLIPLAPFIMIVMIVWFGTRSRQAEYQRRAEMQKELLTKFSSAQELAEFMKTDGGKLFMPEPQKVRSPANRVGVACLVLIVGIGLLVARVFATMDRDAQQGISIGGVIVIAAGIGLLISGLVSHHLSRKWESETKDSSRIA